MQRAAYISFFFLSWIVSFTAFGADPSHNSAKKHSEKEAAVLIAEAAKLVEEAAKIRTEFDTLRGKAGKTAEVAGLYSRAIDAEEALTKKSRQIEANLKDVPRELLENAKEIEDNNTHVANITKMLKDENTDDTNIPELTDTRRKILKKIEALKEKEKTKLKELGSSMKVTPIQIALLQMKDSLITNVGKLHELQTELATELTTQIPKR